MIGTFLKITMEIITFLFELLKLPLVLVGCLLGVLLVGVIINVFILRSRGMTVSKSKYLVKLHKRGVLKRVFIDLPAILAYDLLNYEPDRFREHGMIIYTGRQGKGKTISMVQYLDTLNQRYAKLKCITNFGFIDEDDELVHWSQLINYVNGIYGVAIGIDETQNWFSSSDSKNFPPEMLEVITQNRKNSRVIVGTAQSFYLLSKAIRTQTTEVRECHTFLRCITFVFKKEPILDFEGNVMEMKNRGCYFFVHSPELREKYDTYKAITRLSKSGFVDKEKRYT